MTVEGMFSKLATERVVFGKPCAEALAAEAERLGARRVFMLVSRTLNTTTDAVATVRERLAGRFAGEFDGIQPHTPREDCVAAAAAAREAGADLVVTLGGGSVTDAGKMVQICLEHDVTATDELERFKTYIEEDGTKHVPEYEGFRVRQVAIPTTLSGGDFNMRAGCTDSARKVKESYMHPMMVPRVVILDPAIAVHTPEWLWLSTGVRAVDHAVETICSQFSNPYSDGIAMHALRLLSRALPRCKERPADLDARLDCLLGMWASMDHNQAGIPMGCSHGIGHMLGGTAGVPHGHTSCVMLPSVLRYNRTVNAEKQRLVSEAMGRPGEDAAEVLDAFIRGLGMPRSLAEVGVGRDQFEVIARNAMHDRHVHTNPRPIKSHEQILEILEMTA